MPLKFANGRLRFDFHNSYSGVQRRFQYVLQSQWSCMKWQQNIF